MDKLDTSWPSEGWGEEKALAYFEKAIASRSAKLGDDVCFAHMDPPPPKLASNLVGLNATYNQNLLHPDLSPFASDIEKRLIHWLAPLYGMSDGHMCSGSTLGNLTGIWAAREAGAKRVVGSADAHVSVAKAAHLLGMSYHEVPTLANGQMNSTALAADLSDAVIVLTAGTTSRGAVDPLDLKHNALWTHVDAAWAGPLMLTKHKDTLVGIDRADSLVISAHKWFYQPKDSALVLFKSNRTQASISFGAAYLASPNVGVQGSRSAAAIPLMATLLAWGQSGLASRIENDMQNANHLANFIESNANMQLKQQPTTGVVNWRPVHRNIEFAISELINISSFTIIDDQKWLRQVAANPHVDIKKVCERLSAVCELQTEHS